MIECATEPLLKALKALYFLVSEKNKELELLNMNLEKTVKMRTNELMEANKKLEKISVIDELTGLHNRRFFMTEIGTQNRPRSGAAAANQLSCCRCNGRQTASPPLPPADRFPAQLPVAGRKTSGASHL